MQCPAVPPTGISGIHHQMLHFLAHGLIGEVIKDELRNNIGFQETEHALREWYVLVSPYIHNNSK